VPVGEQAVRRAALATDPRCDELLVDDVALVEAPHARTDL
jgi:hypothetical protein